MADFGGRITKRVCIQVTFGLDRAAGGRDREEERTDEGHFESASEVVSRSRKYLHTRKRQAISAQKPFNRRTSSIDRLSIRVGLVVITDVVLY